VVYDMMLDCGYESPANKAEALRLLADNKGAGNLRICAGGTDLLPRIRSKKEDKPTIVDIARLGLDYINEEADYIKIGAMTSLSSVERFFGGQHQPLRLLSISSGRIGCWQTRNLATLMGNVCVGLPSADAAVTLLAIEAKVKVESLRGERVIPIEEFFVKPRTLALEPDEMATELLIPKQTAAAGQRVGSDFIKIGRRKELFISVLSIGCALSFEPDGTVAKARLAGGVLAPVPVRLHKTEAFLTGKKVTEEVLIAASDVMLSDIKARDSLRGSKRYRENAGAAIMRRVVRGSANCALGV
jgi:CO/xanthine dehydrogenase FAD-binding subunit